MSATLEALLVRLVHAGLGRNGDPMITTGTGSIPLSEVVARAGGITEIVGPVSATVATRAALIAVADDPATLLAGALAALTSGRTLLPLDPRSSAEIVELRLASLRLPPGSVSGVASTLSQAAKALHDSGVPLVDPAQVSPKRPEIRRFDGDLIASMAFTSGSTGAPVPHHRTRTLLARRLERGADGVQAGDRFGMLLGATTSTLGRLIGAALRNADIVCLDARSSSMAEILATFAAERITVLSMIPTYLRRLLTEVASPAALPDLRLVVSGSEPLTWDDVDRIRRLLAENATVLHTYGATESSGRIAMRTIRPDEAVGVGLVPVGTPVDEVTIELVDEVGRPTERGAVGRVTVRRAGGLVVPVGDLARWSPSGELELVGRIDDVVKLGGMRVHLALIETVARGVTGVTDAACTVGPEHLDGDHRGALPSVVLHISCARDADIDAVTASVATSVERLEATRGCSITVRNVAGPIPQLTNGKRDLRTLAGD